MKRALAFVSFFDLFMKVIVYTKTGCPWAAEVMQFLNDCSVPFENRDMTVNEAFAREAEEKSGQCKSPTLDIDGKILADAGVEEVSEYLERLGLTSAR